MKKVHTHLLLHLNAAGTGISASDWHSRVDVVGAFFDRWQTAQLELDDASFSQEI